MAQNYQQSYQQQLKAVAKKLDEPQELNEAYKIMNGEAMEQTSKWAAKYKVVYTSRTHSQLAQAMKEMKVTEYKHLKAVALGSRDQLCINEEVLKDATTSSEKIHLCRAKVKAKQCHYHKNVERALEKPEVTSQTVTDIEDLVKIGRSCQACPYYMSKAISGEADIVFLPYNYVLDPKFLKSATLKLENAVVILDEAHNVEKVCQDAASVEIASSDIATCIEDVQYIMKQLDENASVNFGSEETPDFTIDDCAKLAEMMLALEKAVDSIDQVTSKGRTLSGGKIFELLESANINQSSFNIIVKLISSLLDFLTNATAGKVFARKGVGLTKVENLITIVFGTMTQDVEGWKKTMEKGYRVHVELEEPKKKWGGKSSDGWTSTSSVQTKLNHNAKIINYWCFNPGFGMANLTNRQVHSIILTSGTLAPIKPLISELALNVNYQLENPHVIKSSQVLAKIISSGPDGTVLNGNFNNRDNPKYIHSLGLTIKIVANYTPNGLLVFFPSYGQMNKTQEIWQQTGMWNAIHNVKPIFTEPKRKDEFDECMQDYYSAVKISRGAIFMAVLRGKVSEGLDFKDQNGRAVIIIGLPFPPYLDPRVVLKKEYLETNRTQENQLQNGQNWYNMEATRAVNQAIGRVIRHKDDYGAILLCDQRFHMYKDGLSKWIQSHIKQKKEKFVFGPVVNEIRQFFQNAESTLPKPVEIKEEMKDVDMKLSFNDVQSAKFKTEVIRKQQIKIENSNEIYGSGSNQQSADVKFMESLKKKSVKPLTFMGGLNEDVSSIDFNVSHDIDQASSSSLRTSFKQAPSQSLNEYENASKKPKLKLKPNTAPKEVFFVMMKDPVKVKKFLYEKPVPDDRNAFKEMVRKIFQQKKLQKLKFFTD